ncbi:pyridoxamine 5'-phosphate oxidase family protein [Brevibacillus daliensis]|uniref:pyridoxamine 5'-phosphate oxidase family protein n=1 Tax=Brevibacillus daliensis TaxID=2892995 RepID=UPI001E4075DB|nr:pyridoxamine 5'-phosphate oxidase family protein [Brevibacillus daliensis]
MAETVAESLSEELYQILQQEHFVTLGTVDHESKGPSLNAISWALAIDKKTIRFAVDSRSRIISNVQRNPQVVVNLIGAGSTYSINGKASLLTEKLEDVPLKLAMINIDIESVRDIMFYGSRISVEPRYEKTYNQKAAAKLDQQVMTALRNENI